MGNKVREEGRGRGRDDGCIRYQSVVSPSFRELGTREALVRKSGQPRDKPVALHFFDNTLNLFMTSGVALNVVVPRLHREKPVEATRGIPPRQLLPPPPRSILIIVMKFPGAARSRGSIELVVSFLGDASPDNYFDRRRWNARLFPTFSRDVSNLVSRCRLEKKVTR